ncbi:hypothetical protein BHM03_00029807, partial [Ensete ventricosum]
ATIVDVRQIGQRLLSVLVESLFDTLGLAEISKRRSHFAVEETLAMADCGKSACEQGLRRSYLSAKVTLGCKVPAGRRSLATHGQAARDNGCLQGSSP